MEEIIELKENYKIVKKDKNIYAAYFFAPEPPKWYYENGIWKSDSDYVVNVEKLNVNLKYKQSRNWVKKTLLVNQEQVQLADKKLSNKGFSFTPQLFLNNKEILPKSDWKIGESPSRLEMDYGICKHLLILRNGEFLDYWVFERNPEGNVRIVSNLVKDKEFSLKKPFAIDEKGYVEIIKDNNQKVITKDVFDRVEYPFIVDDSATIYTSSDDGYIQNSGSNYNTVRTAATGSVDASNDVLLIGQRYLFENYYIERSFLFFDTSSIPSDATISSAKIYLKCYQDFSNTDFDVVVQNGQPTYPHSPLQPEDYYYNNYSGNGGSWNTVNYSNENYIYIDLNSDGISWINKGGLTKLCLRSSRDINNIAPSGEERVKFYSYEKGSDFRPYLYLEYPIPSVTITPSIISNNLDTITGSIKRSSVFIPSIISNNLYTITGSVLRGLTLYPNIIESNLNILNHDVSIGIPTIIYHSIIENVLEGLESNIYTSPVTKIYHSIIENILSAIPSNIFYDKTILAPIIESNLEGLDNKTITDIIIKSGIISNIIEILSGKVIILKGHLNINGYLLDTFTIDSAYDFSFQEQSYETEGQLNYVISEKSKTITIKGYIYKATKEEAEEEYQTIMDAIFNVKKEDLPLIMKYRGITFKVFPINFIKIQEPKKQNLIYVSIEYGVNNLWGEN